MSVLIAYPRLVFDTNTLISSLLLPDSLPAKAVRKGLREGIVIVSQSTLTELADVISRSKFDRYLSLDNRRQFFRHFSKVTETVVVVRQIQACRDEKDNKYLELADSGEATAIITGDSDLLILHPFKTIQIITSKHFLNEDI